MASSSSSACKYDVFLSFRGEDTRKIFTDHLHDALKRHGVHTFRDEDKLKRGEAINPNLLKAIEQSSIAIPFFSKNYAGSSWCLTELAKIVAHNLQIIPVFYDIEPTEVRHQKGKVMEEAFAHHRKRHGKSTVKNWKDAMSKVAGISGYFVKDVQGGYEAKIIQLIVKNVMTRVQTGHMLLPEKLVGMDARVDPILQVFDLSANDVRIIGIVGMGGLGKTTLAKAIYNRVISNFDEACFLVNISEAASQHNGLILLQKQLIVGTREDESKVYTIDAGANSIRRSLQLKRALVVLDDVDDQEQLQALAGDTKWFGPGSRIIITTRNERTLILHKVPSEFIFYPDVLSQVDSIKLLNYHAFRKDEPPKEFKDLSKEVVSKVGNLPLALKVIGSDLLGSNLKEWREMLSMLNLRPKCEVERTLRNSFNGLDNEEKLIFLVITCLYLGMKESYAIYCLENSGFKIPTRAIKTLRHKCLLKVNDDEGCFKCTI